MKTRKFFYKGSGKKKAITKRRKQLAKFRRIRQLRNLR